jgi:hypothetical protein
MRYPNATERTALAWLCQQGYDESAIGYYPNWSPDFVTTDGRGWEIKRLFNGGCSFTTRQIATLRKTPDVSVVFMRDGEVEPFAVVPFATLRLPAGKIGPYSLHVHHQPDHSPTFVVYTEEDLEHWLLDQRPERRYRLMTINTAPLARDEKAVAA